MATSVDVLIPTRDRPEALAVTLGGLAAQRSAGFAVTVSDQSRQPVETHPLVATTSRILRHRGTPLRVLRHLPVRGLAEQRDFLLGTARRPHVLFLDDDVWLEPSALEVLAAAMASLRCGFVGYAVQGLSFLDDVREHEMAPYEEWQGPVCPERVRRGTPAWDRHLLHNAANLVHLARRRPTPPRGWRAYKVAWIGGCVLYDRRALADSGGFAFWRRVPPTHAGEDVAAQLRVMERHGGAGLLPSRAFHLQLPTTVPVRDVDCYDLVIEGAAAESEHVSRT